MAPKRKASAASTDKPPKKSKNESSGKPVKEVAPKKDKKIKEYFTEAKKGSKDKIGKTSTKDRDSVKHKSPKKSKETSSSTTAKDVANENQSVASPKTSPKKETVNVSKISNKVFKVLSWNISGVRAWLKKDGLNIIKEESPDVVCLQETKCSLSKLPSEIKSLKGYTTYFAAAKKEGYSGVGLLSKVKPTSVDIGIGEPMHDDEGRCITAEYDQFYVVNAYVPNSGKNLVTLDKRMDWEKKMTDYLCTLDKKKPVIYCGDLNVSHKAIDLANPKNNVKNAGYTIEERTCFTELLEKGFIDSYRHLYPDKEKQYTFWTYMMNCRAKNIGWRLDYFVLSKALVSRLEDNIIHSKVMGSDHCPISLILKNE